jgi:hypothetical protein
MKTHAANEWGFHLLSPVGKAQAIGALVAHHAHCFLAQLAVKISACEAVICGDR